MNTWRGLLHGKVFPFLTQRNGTWVLEPMEIFIRKKCPEACRSPDHIKTGNIVNDIISVYLCWQYCPISLDINCWASINDEIINWISASFSIYRNFQCADDNWDYNGQFVMRSLTSKKESKTLKTRIRESLVQMSCSSAKVTKKEKWNFQNLQV